MHVGYQWLLGGPLGTAAHQSMYLYSMLGCLAPAGWWQVLDTTYMQTSCNTRLLAGSLFMFIRCTSDIMLPLLFG